MDGARHNDMEGIDTRTPFLVNFYFFNAPLTSPIHNYLDTYKSDIFIPQFMAHTLRTLVLSRCANSTSREKGTISMLYHRLNEQDLSWSTYLQL